MAIKILMAEDANQIDAVFKVRHQVFVTEEGLLKEEGAFNQDQKRLFDRYDTFPSTCNLVAQIDNQIVGAYRLCLDCEQGLPADHYFDFRQYLPDDAKIMHASMLCIAEKYRSSGLVTGFILMSAYFAASNQVTHTVAPINPAIGRMLERIGFKQVAEEFVEPLSGAVMRPMVMETANFSDYFLSFVQNNQLYDFLTAYQRWFFTAGEQIIRAGEIGNEAFVLISGEVEVKLPGSNQTVAVIKAGEIFGEMALLTDEKRAADVYAKNDVQVMALSKQEFMKRFVQQPEHAISMFKLMSSRTQSLLNQLQS